MQRRRLPDERTGVGSERPHPKNTQHEKGRTAMGIAIAGMIAQGVVVIIGTIYNMFV